MAQNPWLVFHNKNPQAELRLFYFHYAGGGASAYRNWVDYLPQTIELIAIQLPGREGRFKEALVTQFEPLIDTLVRVIRPYLDIPFVVFGHSLGTIISFEWIRALKRQHLNQPLLYIPAGRRAPQFPDKDPPIYHLPEKEFVQELLKEYQETLGPVLQNKELKQLLLPMLRADFGLAETYQYQEGIRIDCPIIAFVGENEQDIEEQELPGWGKHTIGPFHAYRFPGDHFFIRWSEAQVLQKIKCELALLTSTPKKVPTCQVEQSR